MVYLEWPPLMAPGEEGLDHRPGLAALTETGDDLRPAGQVTAGLASLALEDTQPGSLRHPGLLLAGVGDVEVRALQ